MYRKFRLITAFIGISALVVVLSTATKTDAKYRGVDDYIKHQREYNNDIKKDCDRHEDAESHNRGEFLGSRQLPPGLVRVFRKFNLGTVSETSTNGVPAPVEKTGQTKSYSAGDDGELEKGVTWPNDRFMDNSDGTVTDNLTGLIWLKDANRYGGAQNWNNALMICNSMADDGVYLKDGSVPGDWRLPNVNELLSLIHYGYSYPAIPDTLGTGQLTEGSPFINLQNWNYWTSTTYTSGDGGRAMVVSAATGYVTSSTKSVAQYVWFVRGGQ